uniref:Uncharacterized protein n=1 Tax=Trypanosoma congolense (strain IL3000) TaxID=1068625 RepID=G0UPR2_TRYCI|nr:hypothetical protein, unlikely [Trypanosoma congolense IL3000]
MLVSSLPLLCLLAFRLPLRCGVRVGFLRHTAFPSRFYSSFSSPGSTLIVNFSVFQTVIGTYFRAGFLLCCFTALYLVCGTPAKSFMPLIFLPVDTSNFYSHLQVLLHI